jgi:dipeptidase E
MNLLLLSNSTNSGEAYLSYPKGYIKEFLGSTPVKALFIPYAAVTFTFDEYEQRVNERFHEIGHEVVSVHHFLDPVEAVRNATAIVIGGGNTFHLLRHLQKNNLLEMIRKRVLEGIPYIGWSAGSNITCPTICTTNDMPIVETDGFKALNLVPFQINPHYTDFVPEGFGGETRDQRITEFLAANPLVPVIGLREGTLLRYTDTCLTLVGPYPAKWFRYKQPAVELNSTDNLNILLS